MKNYYDSHFYELQKMSSYESAKEVVPALIELLQPNSVMDVGCGLGTWAKAFLETHVSNVIGLDGAYVDVNDLFIPKENFQVQNITEPFNLGRKFDLLISLEVGEHIPNHLDTIYFKNLISHSDVIFFSAAVPNQGGTDHINEQWQDYWANKFFEEGYVALDFIRRRFWNSEKVQPHYIQNSSLYVKREVISKSKALSEEFEKSEGSPISIIHPKIWESHIDLKKQTVRNQFSKFLDVLKYRVKKRITGNG